MANPEIDALKKQADSSTPNTIISEMFGLALDYDLDGEEIDTHGWNPWASSLCVR